MICWKAFAQTEKIQQRKKIQKNQNVKNVKQVTGFHAESAS